MQGNENLVLLATSVVKLAIFLGIVLMDTLGRIVVSATPVEILDIYLEIAQMADHQVIYTLLWIVPITYAYMPHVLWICIH